ncbi:MAG TPA: GIY-YIG nuclease family protein [Candidatus Dormibacteraeota bacterium]
MTAAPQPLGRLITIVDIVLRVVVWGTQAAAAVTYLAVTAQPAAWRHLYATNPVDTIFFWLTGLSMVMLWVLCLWEEARLFYDRRLQRLHRKVGLVCQLGALLVAGLAAAQLPHRAGWFAVLGAVSFAAFATWACWMQTRFLPDEDQAVIDTIIHREAAERAAVYDASERERRRERLTAIVENLGYALIDAPTRTDKPAEAPAVKWTIPAGKHAPLVYFIRNGNRMKIGTTTELKRRIRTLALRQENVALLVNGDQRREREFHKQFAEHRIGRTEWFAYEGTLADYVHEQTKRVAQEGQEK